MSTDATAIVFFGFPLPDLRCDHCDLNSDWEHDHRPKEPEDDGNYTSPGWDEWRDRLREWKATSQYVEIDFCGSDESQKFFVHCPCFETRVDWDLKPLTLRQDTGDAQQWLDAFCDRFNLPKKPAGWHIGARWF